MHQFTFKIELSYMFVSHITEVTLILKQRIIEAIKMPKTEIILEILTH
jgi:hypothetical protein